MTGPQITICSSWISASSSSAGDALLLARVDDGVARR
jgi:hypothetical protein